MEKTLSIQVFSVRDRMTTAEETRETFKALSSYGFTGIQTAGAFTFGVEEYAAAAKDARLKVIGTHWGMNELLNTEEAVRVHRLLDTKYAGVGAVSGVSEKGWAKEALIDYCKTANKVGEALAPYGIGFTYHHHAFEFASYGDETMMDVLVKELDPETTSFVLDTHWLQKGGVNIIEWLNKLEGRVKILHLKDYAVNFGENNGYITELGNGNINFKEVIRVAENTGVEHLCYEQDNAVNGDSLASAKQSAEYFYSIMK
ncbi:MAG: sugar phosphate isomerase/epimerase [Acutalibacteraceae bacterium]|nr:sugar phosphate isomerase/epimerase [Acutalibacteraceae bacterium]